MKRYVSLDKLHDFYQPPPPSWLPQTIGWYVIFALLILLLAWMLWRVWVRWRHNRYRREALRELKQASCLEIPALLKRTALAAWPREKVAGLSGEPWLKFLDANGDGGSFRNGSGRLLLHVDYRAANLTPEEERSLRQAANDWIRSHHVRA